MHAHITIVLAVKIKWANNATLCVFAMGAHLVTANQKHGINIWQFKFFDIFVLNNCVRNLVNIRTEHPGRKQSPPKKNTQHTMIREKNAQWRKHRGPRSAPGARQPPQGRGALTRGPGRGGTGTAGESSGCKPQRESSEIILGIWG